MSMNDSTLSGVLKGISVWSPELSTGGPILGEKNIPLMVEERAKCQAECLKMRDTHKMTISWGKMIINHHTNSNEDLISFYLGLGWEESVSQLLKGPFQVTEHVEDGFQHDAWMPWEEPFNHPWELSTWSPIHNSNPSPHCTKTCSRPLCFRYASKSSILA